MDVLSELLNTVGFGDVEFASIILNEGAGASVERPAARPAIDLLAVKSGAILLCLSGTPERSLWVGSGDMAMLPRGEPCRMVAAPDSGTCRLVHARLVLDRPFFRPLRDALPAILPLRRCEPDGERIVQLVDLAIEEGGGHRAGRETVLALTADLAFAEIVRHHFEACGSEGPDWQSGLRDPHLGDALRILHERPLADWTVESLAREVGLSRSVLAERFHRHFGVGVMHYLLGWRMETAARLLSLPGISIAEAGAEIGYRSDAAFSRAFKRHKGVSPGVWRGKRPIIAADRQKRGAVHGLAS